MFAAAAFSVVGVLLVVVLLGLLSSSSQGRVVSMLVLTRKPIEGKSDFVLQTSDGPITIRVNEVRGQNVKIGIVAPRSVQVGRPEWSTKNEPARA